MNPHPLITNNPIFIINLERREDKRVYVCSEMERVGIRKWGMFTAYDTKPGKIGCAKSHLDIMSRAKGTSEIFTIFEDDVKFLQPWSEINKAIDELPNNWDALYLGASPQQIQQRHSDHLFRLVNGKVTHAIIWNNAHGVVDYILQTQPLFPHLSIDRFFAEIIQPIRCIYITSPLACTQQLIKHSDTCKTVDLSTIQRNFNKYCK